MKIGVLHPGEMGISVAVSAREGGHDVLWCAEGRSQATVARAEKGGLRKCATLAELCQESEILLSVCPPHAAAALAESVQKSGFAGLYVDANAISPEKSRAIERRLADGGIEFVDGGIIGPPARRPGTTRLYLSGAKARRVAECFRAGPLAACAIGERSGDASALKMCYAAYTKGTAALLCAIFATAGAHGVLDCLRAQWQADRPGLAEEREKAVRDVTRKAWRFAGEFEEIAKTFADCGQPDGFHLAAATICHRLAGFKDAADAPPLQDVLAALDTPPAPRRP